VETIKRKERLATLIKRLNNGVDIAKRDLENALTVDQYEQYKQRNEEQKQIRADLKEKPKAIIEYEKKLKVAIFEFNRAEGYSQSTKRKLVKDNLGLLTNVRAYRRSESHCEHLIEYLSEQLFADPSLSIWFDREIIFGVEGNLGTTPDTLPRVVTSRSLERIGSGILQSKVSKRDVKLRVLEDALATITEDERLASRTRDEELHEEEEQAKLLSNAQKMLKNIRKR
jgi:hypothetical protein